MHRSGTTFLQRLLSVDTRSRSTKLFELWNDGVKFRAASRAEYENDDISLVAPVTKKVKMVRMRVGLGIGLRKTLVLLLWL